MKPFGGRAGVDPTATARALWLETHHFPKGEEETQTATALAGNGNDRNGVKRNPKVDRKGPNYKTNPISRIARSDLA